MLLYTFTVQNIGINKGRNDHQQHNRHEDPNGAGKAGGDDRKAADDPKPARKAVGLVPVFLAVKGPGDLDADGVILLTFGHIVADDHKQQTHKHRNKDLDSYRYTKNDAVGGRIKHKGQNRNDPEDQLQDLSAVVFALGIGKCAKNTQPLGSQQDAGQTKYSKALTTPAIDLSGCVPVGRDLLR